MNELLVSYCNVNDQFKSLALINPFSERCEFIKVLPPRCKGATGIADINIGYAVACHSRKHDKPIIVFLNKQLQHAFTYHTELMADAHSMIYRHPYLYCVSTGNNCIIRIELYGGMPIEEIVFCRITGNMHDVCHANSIAMDKNKRLIISMFGHVDCIDGCICYVDAIMLNRLHSIIKDGLNEPHSLEVANNNLIYCESSDKAFITETGSKIRLDGYARGVAYDDKYYYVGISGSRQYSRHTGLLKPDYDPSVKMGIWIIDRKTEKPIKKCIPVSAEYEIYDIVIHKT